MNSGTIVARMTRQEAVTELGLGWVAAERGEPFDATRSAPWQEGFNLWKKFHPVPRFGIASAIPSSANPCPQKDGR